MFKVGLTEQRLTSPHQRCDGSRPCTTCVDGKRGDECTYEPWQPPRRTHTEVLSVSHNSTSVPPSTRTSPPQASANRRSFPESLICPPSDDPLLTWSNASELASNLPMPLSHCERPLVPATRYPSRLTPRLTITSLPVLPSDRFRTIPRPLRVPLLLIPPEHVQVSSTAKSDLDMILYINGFSFHRVVGTNP